MQVALSKAKAMEGKSYQKKSNILHSQSYNLSLCLRHRPKGKGNNFLLLLSLIAHCLLNATKAGPMVALSYQRVMINAIRDQRAYA
jgi:hypothetical protein